MSGYHFVTSESVSEGHPDKIADQISDAILDDLLRQDPHARVACETFVKTGMAIVGGEITTSAWVDVDKIARDVIQKIGYTDADMGFDYNSCAVISAIGKQSPDIAMGVDRKNAKLGAGDQGIMFGYATDETAAFMPASIHYSHQLMMRQAHLRKTHKLPWLRPDAKAQLTLEYQNQRPVRIHTVVLSTQHTADISHTQLQEAVMEEIIKPVLPAHWLTDDTVYHINPTGRFVIGGPQGDTGLTGRKIIVDTYGGVAHHGGGAFSGKDPSKVDRSAAYGARYVAKHLVAAGLAARLEVQLCYAIGLDHPLAISVNTFGTGKVDDEILVKIIEDLFDLSPQGLIDMLDLLKPRYLATAAYGHFGRTESEFSWETLDKVDAIKHHGLLR